MLVGKGALMQSIKTEVIINAPLEKVWAVLTDFEAFEQWNPFIRAIKGTAVMGEKIIVTVQPKGQKPMSFKARVLSHKPNDEFIWQGILGMRGLFNGKYSLSVEVINDTQTRFIQNEIFTGLLVTLFWGKIGESAKLGFEEMNQALKQRCEA